MGTGIAQRATRVFVLRGIQHMTRFTVFILRISCALLALVMLALVMLLRMWQGASLADACHVLPFGLALAWCVAPEADDVRAFVALMRCDD